MHVLVTLFYYYIRWGSLEKFNQQNVYLLYNGYLLDWFTWWSVYLNKSNLQTRMKEKPLVAQVMMLTQHTRRIYFKSDIATTVCRKSEAKKAMHVHSPHKIITIYIFNFSVKILQVWKTWIKLNPVIIS